MRTTSTDDKDKRRNVVRTGNDKTEAQEILKAIVWQLAGEESKVMNVARLTFNGPSEAGADGLYKKAGSAP